MDKNFLDKIKNIKTEIEITGDLLNLPSIAFNDPSKPKAIITELEEKRVTPDVVNLSELLYQELFKDPADIISLPIESIRIILLMIAYTKAFHFNQLHTAYTPELFADEFMTRDNSYIVAIIPNTVISPSRSGKRIANAFLALQKNTTRTIKSKNANGDVVTSSVSFVERFANVKGRTRFEMSVYWLEKLANIAAYNKVIFDLVYNIPNTKHFVFALWLKRIHRFKGEKFSDKNYKEWHTIKIEDLQQQFGLVGKDQDYINQKFLKPLQKQLFQYNDLSFAFKYEKGVYYFTALPVKSNVVIEDMSPQNSYEFKVNYEVSRLRVKHKLDAASLRHIATIYLNSKKDKHIMEEAYNVFKSKVRSNKEKLSDYVGLRFLDLWQEEIITFYSMTEVAKVRPDGYPKVNTAF